MFFLDPDLLFLHDFSVQPAQTGRSVPLVDSPFPSLFQGPGCVEFTSFPNHSFSQKEDLPLPYGDIIFFYLLRLTVQVEGICGGKKREKQKANSILG